MKSIVFAFLALFSVASCFQLPKFSSQKLSMKVNSALPNLAPSILLIPTVAMADDGSQNAFLYPLIISFLTMGPFLYYQQALKPKPRTVQQIEIDPKTLKAKDTKSASGKSGEARAGKR